MSAISEPNEEKDKSQPCAIFEVMPLELELSRWRQDVDQLNKWIIKAQGLEKNPNLLAEHLKKFPENNLPNYAEQLKNTIAARQLLYNGQLVKAIPDMARSQQWDLHGSANLNYLVANSVLLRLTPKGVVFEEERRPQSDWQNEVTKRVQSIFNINKRSLDKLHQALLLLSQSGSSGQKWSLSLIEPLWRGLMGDQPEYPRSALRLALWQLHSEKNEPYRLEPSNQQNRGWLFPGRDQRLTTYELVCRQSGHTQEVQHDE